MSIKELNKKVDLFADRHCGKLRDVFYLIVTSYWLMAVFFTDDLLKLY